MPFSRSSRDPIDEAAEILDSSSYTVLLGGAGLSAEIGLPLYRGQRGGVAEELKLMESGAFRENPGKAWSLYLDIYRKSINAPVDKPPYKHIEKMVTAGLIHAVITTNIDGLFRRIIRSPSYPLVELHGSVHRAQCTRCGHVEETRRVAAETPYPRCPRCGAPMRPRVTLYGERVSHRELLAAIIEAETAEVMIVAGFSGAVAPANMLPMLTHRRGGRLIVINPSKTPYIRLPRVLWLPYTAGYAFRKLSSRLL